VLRKISKSKLCVLQNSGREKSVDKERSDPRMMETKSRKKTGPKPIYGEAKKMVSFRLSPEALNIIKSLADRDSLSQAEVLERWARQFKSTGVVNTPTQESAISENRDLVAAER